MKAKLFLLLLLISIPVFSQEAPNIGEMMANKVDPSLVADSYNFSWKYTMDIKSSGKSFQADYLLEPNAKYFGMNMTQSGNTVTMIMDTDKKINVMTFGNGGQKMGMATKMPDYTAMAKKEEGNKKFTYKSLPEKTILTYKCKGVQATNGDMVIDFYYTNDAPVNFADLFKTPGTQIPDAFGGYFKPGEKPLMMSVEIEDKVKNKKTSMNCVALDKSVYTFKKSDYRFM